MNAVDPLVADYLGRLDRAAAGLPADRRAELVLEIRDHIAAAQADGATDEAGLRAVLDRLGPPEEIAAAARDDEPPASPALRQPGTALETAAVMLLTVGSLVPVVGWLAGAVLLWTSRRWTAAEKLLGTLVVPFGPGGLLVLAPFVLAGLDRSEVCTGAPAVPGAEGLEAATTCTTTGPPGWVTAAVVAAYVLVPVLVGVLLLRRARRRAAAEAPEPVRGPADSPWGALEVGGVLMLGLGGLLVPLVGALVGYVLVCCSSRWRPREKVVAGCLALLPLLLPLSALVVARSSL